MTISLTSIPEALSATFCQTTYQVTFISLEQLHLWFETYWPVIATASFIIFMTIGYGALLAIKLEDNAFIKGVRRHLKSRAETGTDEATAALPGDVLAHSAQHNSRFIRVGKFHGKYGSQLRPHVGPNGVSELKVMTFFSVNVPQAQAFQFSIGLLAGQWRDAIKRHDFADRLSWQVSAAELLETLRQEENVRLLRELFLLGPGQITCDDKEFLIQLDCSLTRSAQLEHFYKTARALFYAYARVAQMNIPEWRAPENNYDWWAEDSAADAGLKAIDN